MSAETSSTRDPFPIEAPRPAYPKRVALLVVGAVIVLAVITSVVILSVGRGKAGSSFHPGEELTSSDGTFTLTLPEGWTDETAEYREGFLEDNDTESGIEGFVSIDGLPHFFTENYVTVSGHVRSSITVTADAIVASDSSYWSGRFDDLELSTSEEATTDAGDEIVYTTLRGTEGGRSWQVMLVVVMGGDSYAKFILESRHNHDDARDGLLASAKTLVFAPVDPTEVMVDDTWYLPHNDGRTYSSEGGASMLIPDSWLYIGDMWNADALNPSINFDFLGFWQIGGSIGDNPFDIVSVAITVSPNGYRDQTAEELVATELGAVGETRVNSSGVTYTVEAIDEWSAPGADDAACGLTRADYSTVLEEWADQGDTYGITFALLKGDLLLVAHLQFHGPVDDAVLATVEEALQTVEMYP